MTYPNTVVALVCALLLVGCSSSQPTTTSSSPSEQTTGQPESPESESSADAQSVAPDTSAQDAALPAQAPQDWFHLDESSGRIPGLATRTAYETVLKNRSPQDTVVVAIIDSGIDVDHEDLNVTTWTNDDEVPATTRTTTAMATSTT